MDGGKHWRDLRRFDWPSGQDQSDHHSHPYEVIKRLRAVVENSRGASCAFALKRFLLDFLHALLQRTMMEK